MIYAFLKKHNHVKVANSLRKAAKHVVDLKDGTDVDVTSLEDIVRQHKALAEAAVSPPPSV